jgi:hypothetical protein
MALLERKPAHEVILDHLEAVVEFEIQPKPDQFALIAHNNSVEVTVVTLLSVLDKMIIPESARTGIIERLRKLQSISVFHDCFTAPIGRLSAIEQSPA